MTAPRKCDEQLTCVSYISGDSKPPNHDVRDKYTCKHWLLLDLKKCQKVRARYGEIACDIKKTKRIKDENKD